MFHFRVRYGNGWGHLAVSPDFEDWISPVIRLSDDSRTNQYLTESV